jgi:cytochrome c556
VPSREAGFVKGGLAASLESMGERDDRFREWLEESIGSARKLEEALRAGDPAASSEELARLKAACARCHREYRS